LDCYDGNECTVEYCQAYVGCQYFERGRPCEDGNSCTAGELCLDFRCQFGQPLANGAPCDDGNPETTGETCQNQTCTPPPSPCGDVSHDPKTSGWYGGLCNQPHSGDAITDADAVCVAGLTDTFAGFDSVAQVCEVLDPSHHNNGPCDKANTELISLALNICKSRICASNPIVSGCGGTTTVAQSLTSADGILSGLSGTDEASCSQAECLGKEINNGHALELDTLTSSREETSIRLRWVAPSIDDGQSTPRYKILRREIGAFTPFVEFDSTTGTTYVDHTAGPVSFEYDVTPIF
jgi:hypothetical protein